MAHDLLNETVIGLAEAARLLPGSRGASRVSPATIFRWATIGTKRRDGQKVRLESFRAGSRILTTREALARYFASLEVPTEPIEVAPRTPAVRRRASELAEKALIAAGC
jgi:hypothetical protein